MKKIYTSIYLLLSLFAMTACSDWLDIEPEGQATNDKLTETGDGYRTMLSGVYKAMTSKNLYGVELQFGIVDCISQQYTWDWMSSSGTSVNTIYREARDFNYYNVDLRETIDAIWKDGYNAIANANNLIQNIKDEDPNKFAEGELERDMILGEAYACRALMHFDLCRLFAPAPIENETGKYLPYVDVYPNIQPEAIEVKPFLEKVVADFKEAQRLTARIDTTALGLSANATANARFYNQLEYGMEGAADEGASVDDFFLERGYRLNYYAITALLARVYQYMGEDDLAFECAEQVMNFKAAGANNMLYMMFTPDDWTIMNSAENNESRTDLKIVSNLIFALYNEDAYIDYGLGTFFQKRSDEQGGNPSWFVVDLGGQDIFKSTDGTDERDRDFRARFLLFAPDYNVFAWNSDYRVSTKWYCSEDESIRTKNVQTLPIIRATEIRYIMAEHYARQGNFTEAYNILNTIRSARGLDTSLQERNDLDQFLQDMIRDAQREWISEGQLFYLYKRLGAKVKIGNTSRKMNKSEYMLPIPDNQNM